MNHITFDAASLIFYFSIAGTLFAGYRAATRLTTKKCAFGEECPYVFGMPACIIGFVFFVIILGSSAGARFGYLSPVLAAQGVFWGALIGTAFSGILALKEFLADIRATRPLILSSCTYGFFVFAGILALAVVG